MMGIAPHRVPRIIHSVTPVWRAKCDLRAKFCGMWGIAWQRTAIDRCASTISSRPCRHSRTSAKGLQKRGSRSRGRLADLIQYLDYRQNHHFRLIDWDVVARIRHELVASPR